MSEQDSETEYYIQLCASIGRDLLASIRDAQGESEPDSVLIKRLVGSESDAFATQLKDPVERDRFAQAVKAQFEYLVYAATLVEKSEAEVRGGGQELQSLNLTEIAHLVPYALLAVTAFSLLFSFRAGPEGMSVTIPNNELLKSLVDKNSIATVIDSIRGKKANLSGESGQE